MFDNQRINKIPRWAVGMFAVGNILAVAGLFVTFAIGFSGLLVTALGLAMAAQGLRKAEQVLTDD